MSVQLLDENFNFDNLVLTSPVGVQGGAYFSKLKYGNERLIIQTPKCKTKNGIKKKSKKSYCDLMFENDEIDFYEWNDTFEEKIKNLIFKNKESWFHDDLEKEDIDYNWNSSVRSYKTKYYLFRTYIEKSKMNTKPRLQIFNEDEQKISIDEIDPKDNMICVVEIKGLKFTSQSFHLECNLIQIMVINSEEEEEECLIKIKRKHLEKTSNKQSNSIKYIESEKSEEVEEMKNDKVDEHVKLEDSTEEEPKEEESKEEESKEEEPIHEEMQSNNIEDNEVTLSIEETNNMENKEEINEDENNSNENEVSNDLEKTNNLKDLEKTNEILEVNLELPDDLEINCMKLKKPKEVYIEMYEQALKKAKLAKKLAIEAYLESKEIKKAYNLDFDDEEDDDLEKIIYSEKNENNLTNN